MEIGGYRELDLKKGNEYFKGENVARLNTGRAGILHALRCMQCQKIYMPYYECITVQNFLRKYGIKISFYHINEYFEPLITERIDEETSLLLVNYFGLVPIRKMMEYCKLYKNVVIDNTQAFFSPPIDNAYCIYSARKFFGVPDGAYVVGKKAQNGVHHYPKDESADTALFLLKRIESGGNNNYSLYLKNEKRLDNSGVLQMSGLTHSLLDNIDYIGCKKRRMQNFNVAKKLFEPLNKLKIPLLKFNQIAPIAYPLVIENKELRKHLKRSGIYVGQWWKYIIKEMSEQDIEYYFAQYLIPIQIDHRYTEVEIEYEKKIVIEGLK